MGRKIDWTPEKIKYELDKISFNFTQVDRRHSLSKNAAHKAARLPHKSGELAIAEVLSVSPQSIWPSRHNNEGTRLDPQPDYNYTYVKKKSNIRKISLNRQDALEVKHAS